MFCICASLCASTEYPLQHTALALSILLVLFCSSHKLNGGTVLTWYPRCTLCTCYTILLSFWLWFALAADASDRHRQFGSLLKHYRQNCCLHHGIICARLYISALQPANVMGRWCHACHDPSYYFRDLVCARPIMSSMRCGQTCQYSAPSKSFTTLYVCRSTYYVQGVYLYASL